MPNNCNKKVGWIAESRTVGGGRNEADRWQTELPRIAPKIRQTSHDSLIIKRCSLIAVLFYLHLKNFLSFFYIISYYHIRQIMFASYRPIKTKF